VALHLASGQVQSANVAVQLAGSDQGRSLQRACAHCDRDLAVGRRSLQVECSMRQDCLTLSSHVLLSCVYITQEVHGGQLLKISSQAEDDFVRLNLLWTGFFGETCEYHRLGRACSTGKACSTGSTNVL
jgi:hypothetical protein